MEIKQKVAQPEGSVFYHFAHEIQDFIMSQLHPGILLTFNVNVRNAVNMVRVWDLHLYYKCRDISESLRTVPK